ncbi:hypothetical protein PDO_5175, partial [Rhizobium sp. PDO1-076]
ASFAGISSVKFTMPLEDLKTIAKQWLTDPKRIEKDLAAGILNEVQHDNEG